MSQRLEVDHGSICVPSVMGLYNDKNKKNLSVLIVDDDETNRIVLEVMLRSDGHAVHMARDGGEAVSLYESVHPDLILMDVMMPVMDGYEATSRIKKLAGLHFVPIIFLTALTDEWSLVKCLEVGGDDFILKPVSRIILRAKLAAAARIHGLYHDLELQKRDLSAHHERLRYEHGLAEQVFAKIVGSHGADAPNIRSMLSPLAITNGDLLLVSSSPEGAQYVLLGDCTGHGLSAAIGAIPITDIFYSMTKRGFGVREIVLEMNRRLRATLPTGQFLAACILELNGYKGRINVWNGGIPDAIIVSGKDVNATCIPSRNVPLGVVDNSELNISIEIRQIQCGDRIFLYSDGLIEARNGGGKMFGQERLVDIVASNHDRGHLFDDIQGGVEAFREGRPQEDDIALVEVLYDEGMLKCDEPGGAVERLRPSYDMSMRLGPGSLRDFDPMTLVNMLASVVPVLAGRQSHVYTIIAELYSNALNHGVLGLDCGLKKTAEGFSQYYEERERLLSGISVGWIHIAAECFWDDGGGELILQVEDSGRGFDPTAARRHIDTGGDVRISGRGMELVKSLCKSLSYDLRGNYVRAVYAW